VAVIVVSGVGSFNDWKKDGQFRKLNEQRDTFEVKVLRDGQQVLVMNTEVVVGDVLILDTGDKVRRMYTAQYASCSFEKVEAVRGRQERKGGGGGGGGGLCIFPNYGFKNIAHALTNPNVAHRNLMVIYILSSGDRGRVLPPRVRPGPRRGVPHGRVRPHEEERGRAVDPLRHPGET
jgi:hypothetical protein